MITPHFEYTCNMIATFLNCAFTKCRKSEDTGAAFYFQSYNRNTVNTNDWQSNAFARSTRLVARNRAATSKINSRSSSTLCLRPIENATRKRTPSRKDAVVVNQIGHNYTMSKPLAYRKPMSTLLTHVNISQHRS